MIIWIVFAVCGLYEMVYIGSFFIEIFSLNIDKSSRPIHFPWATFVAWMSSLGLMVSGFALMNRSNIMVDRIGMCGMLVGAGIFVLAGTSILTKN